MLTAVRVLTSRIASDTCVRTWAQREGMITKNCVPAMVMLYVQIAVFLSSETKDIYKIGKQNQAPHIENANAEYREPEY